MKIENTVFRVTLSGGIIGALTANPKGKLQKKITEMNKQGYRVGQVLPDDTGNILIAILRVIILVCTLFLWTIANGYYVIGEKRIE